MKGVISRVRNESDEEKEQLNGGGKKELKIKENM